MDLDLIKEDIKVSSLDASVTTSGIGLENTVISVSLLFLAKLF